MTEENWQARAEAAEANAEKLAQHIAGMADRFQQELRPHLRNAWMQGHNAGYWNGRASAGLISAEAMDGLSPAERHGLEHGLMECPYITTTEELQAVAAELGVPMKGVENGDS